MELIDKAAVVAELEKRIKETESIQPKFDQFWAGQISAFKGVLKILDTLEVKEVDLDDEIDKFYSMYRKNGRTYSTKDNEECLDWKVDCNPDFKIAFAKHFYELGLKAQKGE